MEQIQLTLAARIEDWNMIRHHLALASVHHNWSVEDTYTITLICEEWFMNIVHHAYKHMALDESRTVEFKLQVKELQVELFFADEGIPFNPFKKEMPQSVTASIEQKIGGLGIYFITKKLTSYQYQYVPPRNCVQMIYTIKQEKGE